MSITRSPASGRLLATLSDTMRFPHLLRELMKSYCRERSTPVPLFFSSAEEEKCSWGIRAFCWDFRFKT